MTTGIQVVFDCADPNQLATFWAAALGYRLQDPPEGFTSWQDWLREQGIPEDHWNDASAVVDPDGGRPRIYFQRVPEAKTVKNRVHLDLHVGRERREDEVARLLGLGATELHRASQGPFEWVTLADTEGNEFCVA